jgi:ligand-binding sensor domain-containing protein
MASLLGFCRHRAAGRLADGVWSRLGSADGLPHSVVHAVVVDEDGAVWLACRRGLGRLAGGEVEVHFPQVNFRSALAGRDGTLWFGTASGIFAWDGTSWNRYLEGRTLYTRLVAADGAVWAGSADAGVVRFDGGTWSEVPLPARLQGSEVFDIAEGRDGSIWLASAAGLGRLVRAP